MISLDSHSDIAAAVAIFQAAVKAVDAGWLVAENSALNGHRLSLARHEYDLSHIGRLVVIGVGKGAAHMARPLEELLGDRIDRGFVIVKYGHAVPLQHIVCREAGHPVPDHAGIQATGEMLDLLVGLQPEDLVIFLLSGGGSSLLEKPVSCISLPDLQATTDLLLSAGVPIHGINIVRKHLSQVKGGQLLKAAYPASMLTLAISDVIGDDPETIASGLTVPDPSTFDNAWHILQHSGMFQQFPAAVLQYLAEGRAGGHPETPKPGDPLFASSAYRIIGSNREMLEAARKSATRAGYDTYILTGRMEGEARALGKRLAALAKSLQRHAARRPLCLLAGGETTVQIKGTGKGGRNQELALAAALELDGTQGITLLSAGSDGTDGPTDAAGAIVDGETIRRARAAGRDAEGYLAHNDSYHFFSKIGGHLVTGPTGTNVMDLVVILVK